MLNDYVHIRDLASANLVRSELLRRIQALAEDAASHLRDVVPRALALAPRLIVATHVPPFREACWHEGRISDDEWLPHFSSKVVGEALVAAAAAHPDASLTVLCGHTHGEGTVEILPNLTKRFTTFGITSQATYRARNVRPDGLSTRFVAWRHATELGEVEAQPSLTRATTTALRVS